MWDGKESMSTPLDKKCALYKVSRTFSPIKLRYYLINRSSSWCNLNELK